MGDVSIPILSGGLCACRTSHSKTIDFQKIFYLNFFTFTNMNINKETDEFPEIVLHSEKAKELDKKIQEGKVVCNLEDPDSCESCSG